MTFHIIGCALTSTGEGSAASVKLQWNLRIKDTLGQGVLSLYREVSFFRRLKCTGILRIGTSRFVLYREVFFIRSVLYQRFHCSSKG